jgi:hypothetical protein
MHSILKPLRVLSDTIIHKPSERSAVTLCDSDRYETEPAGTLCEGETRRAPPVGAFRGRGTIVHRHSEARPWPGKDDPRHSSEVRSPESIEPPATSSFVNSATSTSNTFQDEPFLLHYFPEVIDVGLVLRLSPEDEPVDVPQPRVYRTDQRDKGKQLIAAAVKERA